MKNVGHILTGWGKRLGFIYISSAEEKLANLRLKQCGKCPFAKKSTFLSLINDSAEEAAELKCTKCHCPCSEKAIVVDEKCPMGKW